MYQFTEFYLVIECSHVDFFWTAIYGTILRNYLVKEKVGDRKFPLLNLPPFFCCYSFFVRLLLIVRTALMLLVWDSAETLFVGRDLEIEYRLFRSFLDGWMDHSIFTLQVEGYFTLCLLLSVLSYYAHSLNFSFSQCRPIIDRYFTHDLVISSQCRPIIDRYFTHDLVISSPS